MLRTALRPLKLLKALEAVVEPFGVQTSFVALLKGYELSELSLICRSLNTLNYLFIFLAFFKSNTSLQKTTSYHLKRSKFKFNHNVVKTDTVTLCI